MAQVAVPWTFSTAGPNTPSQRLDDNFAALVAPINARVPTVGPIGSRPAAGTAGRLYIASDQNYQIYLDDGAAWQTLGALRNYQTFAGIATPATPATGLAHVFSPSGNPPLQRLAELDTAGQVWEYADTLGAFAVAGNPHKTVSNTTTETSLFVTAPVIKGGTLGTNRKLYFRLVADFINNTGAARGWTLRMKFGGTMFWGALVTTGFFNSSANAHTLDITGCIAALGATNAQAGQGWVFHQNAAQAQGVMALCGNDAGALVYTWTALHNSLAIDTTADQTLDVTIQHEVASASLSARLWGAFGLRSR